MIGSASMNDESGDGGGVCAHGQHYSRLNNEIDAFFDNCFLRAIQNCFRINSLND